MIRKLVWIALLAPTLAAGQAFWGGSYIRPTNITPQFPGGAAQVVACVSTTIPIKTTVNRVAVQVTTLGSPGNSDVGLYSTNGTMIANVNGFPTTAIGTFNYPLVGAPITLNPGVYYSCACAGNTTARVAALTFVSTVINTIENQAGSNMVTAATPCSLAILPASLGTLTATTTASTTAAFYY